MRALALIPVVLSVAALVLSFLCLFAGSKKGFMEGYALVTLNTSRIGENLLNDSDSSSNPFISFIDNITNSIENDINNELNSLAKDLGLHDFYSAHVLDYCEGFYEPSPLPNVTLKKNGIHKNVTSCSNMTSLYNFDPRDILQKELNETGHSNINLTDINWPSQIDSGLHALRIAWRAMFVLYCIAIGFTGVALLLAIISVCLEGRLSAFINVVVDYLSFLAIALASAISTAVVVKSANVINRHGNSVGISAKRGNKFLALTWVATAIMLMASFLWCFECIVGPRYYRGPHKRRYVGEKR